MVQWVRLRAPNAGGPGFDPACMPQLRPGAAKINNFFLIVLALKKKKEF